jgi:hypothetical protein
MIVNAVSRKVNPRPSEKAIARMRISPTINIKSLNRNIRPTTNPPMASAMAAYPISAFP